MIADKYLQELVNRDEGKIAQLVSMDGGLAEPFRRLTAEHEEMRNYLLQIIRDGKSNWYNTSSRLTEFEKQCQNILYLIFKKEFEENTVAGARAKLFIDSLMRTVAKVRAELFVTSLIDQCLYWVLVDDCDRRQGEPRRSEDKEKYRRIWNQFRYIKHRGGHADRHQKPPWWWLCENPAEGDTQFLKDHKALICEIARKYWEDFLKNIVVEDTEEVVKKVGQSFFGDIENIEYPEQVRKLIEEILKCARMLPFRIRLEDLA